MDNQIFRTMDNQISYRSMDNQILFRTLVDHNQEEVETRKNFQQNG